MGAEGTKVYFMGIGGVAMANMAGVCSALGYEVTGSDAGIYPPTRDIIERLGIHVYTPYNPQNLVDAAPDNVVIGNVIRATNPEAQWVMAKGIPFGSIADLMAQTFFSRHHSLVVAGTHGKTTTTALLAWALTEGGLDPSALVGGFVLRWECGYRVGKGRWVVVEGDEYDTAFFDKRPKFLHYRPYGAVVTGIEFDHADIYATLDAIRQSFTAFVRLIPPEGFLVVSHEEPFRRELEACCRGEVITYGRSPEADWHLASFTPRGTESVATFVHHNATLKVSIPLVGVHNALNALAVSAVLQKVGIPQDTIPHLIRSFPGVRRRQQIIAHWERKGNALTIIDDFAHHPTAVRTTIEAVRLHHKGRRVIAVFEPRTNTSKRKFFQHLYPHALKEADVVLLKAPSDYASLDPAERIDLDRLADDIVQTDYAVPHERPKVFFDAEELITFIENRAREGDVLLFMSNGSMDGVPWKVRAYLSSLYEGSPQ